jgi:hypothetical protein
MFNPGDKVWCSYDAKNTPSAFTATYVGPAEDWYAYQYVQLRDMTDGHVFPWLKNCVHADDPVPALELARAKKRLASAQRAFDRAQRKLEILECIQNARNASAK